jgi:divalent metal cation (Fe/Co/Zn/Cd) transporter
MVKETAAPLLGQAPDPRTVAALEDLICGETGVLGMHDLIVHDYGPGHVFASVHIEVDSRMDVFASHAMIDKLEQDALERLRVMLVGHMDPVDTQDPKVAELRDAVRAALLGIDGVRGMHDLRIVPGARRTNVIFDIVFAHEAPRHTIEAAKARAQSALTDVDPSYHAIVNSELDYVSSGPEGGPATGRRADDDKQS